MINGFRAAIVILTGLYSLSALAMIPAWSNSIAHSPKIRVRLGDASSLAKIHGLDLKIYSSDLKIHQPVAAPDMKSGWEFNCTSSGRVRARLVAGKSKQSLFNLASPVWLQSPAGFMHVNDRPYREIVRLYAVKGHCEVVNEVDLEKYLDGLVNSEFSAKWNEEAIAAQVVAARTYALFQIKRAKKSAHYDVDATVKDQVYDGSMKEDFRSSRSVEKTRGEVLTVTKTAKPEILKAFYHSTCGGFTEVPEKVWGKAFPGFKRPVACHYCATSPRYHWDFEFTGSEMALLLIEGAKKENGLKGWSSDWREALLRGQLVQLQVNHPPTQGLPRATDVDSVWKLSDRLVQLKIPASRFREWLGPGKLRSTAFQIVSAQSPQGTRWHFEGRGNGHGVGMCQWGAKVMGEKGFRTADILKYYYPDASLRKLW